MGIYYSFSELVYNLRVFLSTLTVDQIAAVLTAIKESKKSDDCMPTNDPAVARQTQLQAVVIQHTLEELHPDAKKQVKPGFLNVEELLESLKNEESVKEKIKVVADTRIFCVTNKYGEVVKASSRRYPFITGDSTPISPFFVSKRDAVNFLLTVSVKEAKIAKNDGLALHTMPLVNFLTIDKKNQLDPFAPQTVLMSASRELAIVQEFMLTDVPMSDDYVLTVDYQVELPVKSILLFAVNGVNEYYLSIEDAVMAWKLNKFIKGEEKPEQYTPDPGKNKISKNIAESEDTISRYNSKPHIHVCVVSKEKLCSLFDI